MSADAAAPLAAPLAAATFVSAPGAVLRAHLAAAASVYVEQDTPLLVATLAVVARVDALFYGPPGEGKTALARAVVGAHGLSLFASTLSSWTDDAALLGPVDVPALTAGRYVRVAGKWLPQADVVFLDEIGRAGRGVRDLVLSAYAERALPDGTPIAARAILAATNTALTDEEDRALADRHPLRCTVRPIADDDRWLDVLDGGARPALPPLPAGTLAALDAAFARVTRPRGAGTVGAALAAIRSTLRAGTGLPAGSRAPTVSTRRWIAADRVLRAHAAIHDRDVVTWDDLRVCLPLVLADGDETIPAIAYAVEAAIPAWVSQLAALRALVDDLVALARRKHVDGASLSADEAHALVEAEATIAATAKAIGKEHGDTVGAEAKQIALAALDRLDAVADEAHARRRAARAI